MDHPLQIPDRMAVTYKYSYGGQFGCGYVRLDGADTFLWQLIELDDPAGARPGLRVRAHFREHRHGLMSDFVFKPIAVSIARTEETHG